MKDAPAPTDDLPPVFGIEVLAKALGVTLDGARAAIRRGRIPASRPGKRWVVRRTEFYAALEREERARQPEPKPETDREYLMRLMPPMTRRGRRARP